MPNGLWLALLPLFCASLARSAPFESPPEGFSLVAEDNCGEFDGAPHVVRGEPFVFSTQLVSGPPPLRAIVFDNDYCLLRYKDPVPDASYKVDVVYVTEEKGLREQALEANGQVVHPAIRLPAGKPGRFVFDIPRRAYADGGPLELKFVRKGGANAVVSYVRVWSTNPRPLLGRGPLWQPAGPVEKDWLRQDRLRGKPRFTEWEDPERELRENALPGVDEQLERGRQVLADLTALGAVGIAEHRTALAEATRRRDQLLAEGDVTPQAWLQLYLAARWAVRRLAFSNPLLPRDGLLFVRRHHPHAMHQCSRRLGTFTRPGGGICVLSNIRADGLPQVTCLTEGDFEPGTFGRPDVSFDGARIVFGYASERQKGRGRRTYGAISQQTAPLYAEHKVGLCHEFQLWEMGIDARSPAPRQLTTGPAENSDPLYLPDGRIAFMSHRPGGLVQCGDWALAYCVFTMGPDGSDVRQITRSKDGEWDPFLLDDGTIGFTRWEYVMKFWSPIQMLWSVRPDGTNPRMIYGSDLSRKYAYPLNYAAARQVPGTSRLVCIGSAHHNTGAGPVCLVDLAIGPNDAAGLTRITPVRYVETADKQPHNGWYDCPFPLSEKYFLVSYSFSQHETDTTAYGIYLLDSYGGKELVYRDDELSALFPMPIRPRPQPTALPSVTDQGEGGYGEFLVQDVHVGLDPSHRGQARYLRVVECHERHFHTKPYAIQAGPDSGFETKTVLGTVPVEADGSAYFRVPAGVSVFFSVLDGRHRALHTMRSVTDVQPGERTGCVGCHEPAGRTPVASLPQASSRAPSAIEPPPWGLRRMSFADVVQPVLDQHCTRCHDGTDAKGKAFDLTSSKRRPFMGVDVPASYYTLRKYVRHAPIYSYHMPPGSFGARVSPLLAHLEKGHNDVRLSEGQWRRLCAWIDCNAPAIGDYAVATARPFEVEMREATEKRREAITAALPKRQRLVCYLNCGVDLDSGEEGDCTISETAGSPYVFRAGETVVPPWYDSISFHDREVRYQITGLQGGKRYGIGFSWWDFNNAGREEAVVVSADGGQTAELLPKTRLPAWKDRKQKPEERHVPIPEELSATGEIILSFVNESSAANAVISEVWLVEGGEDR